MHPVDWSGSLLRNPLVRSFPIFLVCFTVLLAVPKKTKKEIGVLHLTGNALLPPKSCGGVREDNRDSFVKEINITLEKQNSGTKNSGSQCGEENAGGHGIPYL
jgi:hypothetical protein